MRKLKKIITAAALAAAMLAGAPRTAAACPYTPGPLGRYIVPAQVLGMYADGDGVQVWCTTWATVATGFLPSIQKPICGFMTGCSSL